MVGTWPDLVIAMWDGKSTGTKDTMDRAPQHRRSRRGDPLNHQLGVRYRRTVEAETVTCPDCGMSWNLATREPCPGCRMPVADLEDAADFILDLDGEAA